MVSRYIYVIFLLVGVCTSCVVDDSYLIVDSRLVEYAEKFEAIYGIEVSVDLTMRELDASVGGRCTVDQYNRRRIVINTLGWDERPLGNKMNLLLHEIGHCMFDLEHDNRMLAEGGEVDVPASFMYGALIPSEIVEELYDYYLFEFGEQMGLLPPGTAGTPVPAAYR